MRFSSLLLFVLFVLIIASCDEGCIIPPEPKPEYQVGDTIWIHDVPGSDSIGIPTIKNLYLAIAQGTDGSIYYAASNGNAIAWIEARIFAVNKDDGSLKWKSEPLDNAGLNSQIVVGDDGTIYAIGHTTLYAFNPDNGILKWSWRCPETLPHPDYPNGAGTFGALNSLALTNDGDLVLSSYGSGYFLRAIYCIDEDGNKKWHNMDATQYGASSRITIGKNGSLFYYSDLEEKINIVSVDPGSGNINWTKEILAIGSSANNIAISEDGSLMCSFKNIDDTEYYLHKVDPANGNIVWTSSATSMINRKLIGPDGAIYQYFQFEGGINRFDPGSGDRALIRGGNLGAIDEKNRLLFNHLTEEGPAYPNNLCLYDIDGTLDWHVSMNNIRGEDFIISDDKVIYGVNSNNQIFAIQSDATLAKTGWPKFAHDNRNTSNANK